MTIVSDPTSRRTSSWAKSSTKTLFRCSSVSAHAPFPVKTCQRQLRSGSGHTHRSFNKSLEIHHRHMHYDSSFWLRREIEVVDRHPIVVISDTHFQQYQGGIWFENIFERGSHSLRSLNREVEVRRTHGLSGISLPPQKKQRPRAHLYYLGRFNTHKKRHGLNARQRLEREGEYKVSVERHLLRLQP